ncbi:hypothetical protein [Gillisia sp. CAL575]|uniref:hypothetical protein n=1 Tax=Gillisia sp. CAL575 TaxID=985255 RepID=UPI001E2E18F5|nr:hypothetical protein [Gillisia sp. CAL575]
MENHNYSVAGIRDGGVINHRNKNPYSINTFFSILNFDEVLKLYNKKKILSSQYIQENEFNDELDLLPFKFDQSSLYEPYYCFYFWLRRKGMKILFLNSKMRDDIDDKISNEVFLPDGSLFLIHTWYARAYGNNKKHTERIDLILDKIDFGENIVEPIIFKDRLFRINKEVRKVFKKIIIKLEKL